MIHGRRAVGGVLAATLLLGCGGPQPAPSSSGDAFPDPTPAFSPVPSAAAPTAAPGRPLDAAAVLAAMRASRRPGGVPDELESERIAARVADAIWTIDGQPWDTMTVGGACGTQQCTLELQGARDGAAGTDAWTLSVDPGSGSVEVVEHTLAALPAVLVDELDRLVRDSEPIGELVLGSVRWLGPEAPERFVLSYRGGNEEESCSVDVTAERGGRIVEVARSGC